MKKLLIYFYSVWFLLVFIIPLISAVAVGGFVDDFVASRKLLTFANYLNIFNFLTLIMAYIILIKNKDSVKEKFRKIKLAVGLLFLWLMLSSVSYNFSSGMLSYALHEISDSQYGEAVESVIKLREMGKRCHMSAKLNGDTFTYNRKICGLPSHTLKQLESGGKLKLSGMINSYGISNFTYTVVDG